MDLKEKLRELRSASQDSYDRGLEQLVDRLGLENKKEPIDVILPALGVFGAGVAVGATLGVLFAPKRGDKLREDIRQRLDDLRRKSTEQYRELKDRSEEALEELSKNDLKTATETREESHVS